MARARGIARYQGASTNVDTALVLSSSLPMPRQPPATTAHICVGNTSPPPHCAVRCHTRRPVTHQNRAGELQQQLLVPTRCPPLLPCHFFLVRFFLSVPKVLLVCCCENCHCAVCCCEDRQCMVW